MEQIDLQSGRRLRDRVLPVSHSLSPQGGPMEYNSTSTTYITLHMVSGTVYFSICVYGPHYPAHLDTVTQQTQNHIQNGGETFCVDLRFTKLSDRVKVSSQQREAGGERDG